MVLEPYKPYNIISFIKVLYNTLRACRPNYNANDYKWRLGAAVIDDIRAENLFININDPTVKITLYGIEVEADLENLYNIQLYEDITNKIAVDEKKGEVIDELKKKS